jgi:hypothetical protein
MRFKKKTPTNLIIDNDGERWLRPAWYNGYQTLREQTLLTEADYMQIIEDNRKVGAKVSDRIIL